MTATAPEQIVFMESHGPPLSTESRKRFVEVSRLSCTSLADVVPGVDPYDFLTVVELEPVEGGVRVTMTADAMHDEEWTQRPAAGRANDRQPRPRDRRLPLS